MKVKYIIFSVLFIIVAYFGYNFFIFSKYGYRLVYEPKAYLWMFNDSAKDDVSKISSGWTRDNDILYHYIYKDKFDVNIWEFKKMGNVSLDQVFVHEGIDLFTDSIKKYQLLDSDTWPTFKTRFRFSLTFPVHINLDEYSKINKTFFSDNYKGFYANINKLAISDKSGQHNVIIEYPYERGAAVVLFFKKADSFFLILANPMYKDKIDEKFIGIFSFIK